MNPHLPHNYWGEQENGQKGYNNSFWTEKKGYSTFLKI
jgi:hypothetical protein